MHELRANLRSFTLSAPSVRFESVWDVAELLVHHCDNATIAKRVRSSHRVNKHHQQQQHMEELAKENQLHRPDPVQDVCADESSLLSYEDEEKGHVPSPLKTRDANILTASSNKSPQAMKRKLSSTVMQQQEISKRQSCEKNNRISPPSSIMSPVGGQEIEDDDQNLSTTGIMKPTPTSAAAAAATSTNTTTTSRTITSETRGLLSQAHEQMGKLQSMLNQAQAQLEGIEDECDQRIEYIAGQLHTQYSKKHAAKVSALRSAYETKWMKKVEILQDELAECKATNTQLQIEIQRERKEKSDLVSLWDQFVECERQQQSS